MLLFLETDESFGLCAPRFQLEREGMSMMSSALALRSSLRPCEAAAVEEVAAAGPAACGGVAAFADEFFVEDLLDLGDLCEVDKDCGAELGGDAAPAAPAEGNVEEEDKLSSDSHGSSSVVSYELMTLPAPHQMIDLPLPVRAEPLLFDLVLRRHARQGGVFLFFIFHFRATGC